jgi:hypothetical protein
MAEVVEVQRDTNARLSRHLWVARQLRVLNRKNKLTSPVFDICEGHQFRLIMLRGLIRASDESADPYGLFIELVSAESVRISLEVQLRDLCGRPLGTSTSTHHFSAQQPRLTLSEIVSADTVTQQDVDAVALEINFTILGSIANVLLKSSVVAGQSLWNVASSWTSMAKAFVAESAPSATVRQCPWDECPASWANRAEQWRFMLLQYLPQNDATFLYGPRQLAAEEELALAEAGVRSRAVAQAASIFEFDRDVHEGLLSSIQPTLRSMRFDLVPAKVNEATFWHNYFWRIECLKLCSTDLQARVLLTVLDAPVHLAVPNQLPNDKTLVIDEIAKAAALCEELLADDASDLDIVTAAADALRQAIASADSSTTRLVTVADAAATLARVQQALVTIPAQGSPHDVSAAQFPVNEGATSMTSDVLASPLATPTAEKSTTHREGATSKTPGSPVVMPWEEDDM